MDASDSTQPTRRRGYRKKRARPLASNLEVHQLLPVCRFWRGVRAFFKSSAARAFTSTSRQELVPRGGFQTLRDLVRCLVKPGAETLARTRIKNPISTGGSNPSLHPDSPNPRRSWASAELPLPIDAGLRGQKQAQTAAAATKGLSSLVYSTKQHLTCIDSPCRLPEVWCRP